MSTESISKFTPVLEELGINPDSLDSSDLDLGGDDVTAATEESSKEDPESEDGDEDGESSESVEESSPEGEEKAATDEATAPEEVPEEKTAEESQDLEASRIAFEAEKKSFTEERLKTETEFVKQYAEKLKAHDDFDSFLSNMASEDSELFSLVQEEYAKFAKANHNPALEGLKKQQEDMAKSLSEIKQKFSDEATRIKYDADLTKVKSTIGKEAESLGIKTDWKLVEDVWAANPKLTLEEAFHAKYGANLAKAAASKAKVQAVENKVQSRPTVSTAGTVQRSNSKQSTSVPSDAHDAVRHFAKQYAGKN